MWRHCEKGVDDHIKGDEKAEIACCKAVGFMNSGNGHRVRKFGSWAVHGGPL